MDSVRPFSNLCRLFNLEHGLSQRLALFSLARYCSAGLLASQNGNHPAVWTTAVEELHSAGGFLWEGV